MSASAIILKPRADRPGQPRGLDRAAEQRGNGYARFLVFSPRTGLIG